MYSLMQKQKHMFLWFIISLKPERSTLQYSKNRYVEIKPESIGLQPSKIKVKVKYNYTHSKIELLKKSKTSLQI